jgi:hypothetical protein
MHSRCTDIERGGLGAALGLILRHARLRRRWIRVLQAAVREFFFPQFQTQLFPGIRPVAVISHPLDDSLPFDPTLFARYLGYFTAWIKTLGSLHRRYGRAAMGEIEGMMRDVIRLYDACGRVYRSCQSTTTTRRPAPHNPFYLLIALFDPHLHCIPSLHVLTICYNYYRTRQIAKKLEPRGVAGNRLVEETYRLALRITEATLLVKQHSLLDIGPSLFLLSRLFPDFKDREIRRFVSDLFSAPGRLDPELAIRIRGLIVDSYTRMVTGLQIKPHKSASQITLEYLKGFRAPRRESGRMWISRSPRRPGGS